MYLNLPKLKRIRYVLDFANVSLNSEMPKV